MKFFTINTNKRKLSIELLIQTLYYKELIIKGLGNNNAKYIDREMYVNGIERFIFNLPVSPDKLILQIIDKKGVDDFKVLRININNLITKPLIIDDETKEFIEFITRFTQVCCKLPQGNYFSKNRKFLIKLFDKIIDERTGAESNTSSRIHSRNNFIEVSKNKFKDLTVSSRMWILLHEFSHNYLNIDPDDEQEADNNATKIYLALGYPKIDSIKSLTPIFHDTPAHINRLKNLDGQLRYD